MKPLQVALIVATTYLVPSLLYISFSSRFVADVGASPEEVMRFEIMKGFGFVVLSALLIFSVTFWTFTRIRSRDRKNQFLREALMRSERFATTGLLAASLSHDARNELTVLKGERARRLGMTGA